MKIIKKEDLMNKTIITLYSNKGGVGKTTIAYLLAELLGLIGAKVLVIDNDSQHNVSSALYCEFDDIDISWLYSEDMSIEKMIINGVKKTRFKNVSCITCSNRILHCRLTEDFNILKDLLNLSTFDVLIIDNPPGHSPQSRYSRLCADYLLLPTELKQFSLTNLNEIFREFSHLQDLNGTKIIIVPNMVNCNQSLNIKTKKEIAYYEALIDLFTDNVSNSILPIDSIIDSSLNDKKSIFLNYFKTSRSVKPYISLVNEIFDIDEDNIYSELKSIINENRIIQNKKNLGLI